MGAELLVDPNELAIAYHIAMQQGSEVRRVASVVAQAAHVLILIFHATIPPVRLLQLTAVSVSSSPILLAAPRLQHA